MNIGKLNKLVETSKLNKSQIATRCGISRTTLENLLSGADAKISTVESLASALGVGMGYLFDDDGSSAIANGAHSVAANTINGNVDNRQFTSDSPDVLRAQIQILDERIKEKDSQIKEKDSQIKEKDSQIKQLLDILQQR